MTVISDLTKNDPRILRFAIAFCLTTIISIGTANKNGLISTAFSAEDAESVNNLIEKGLKKNIEKSIGENKDQGASFQSDNERWNVLKPTIFGDRPIMTDTDVIELDAPNRAFNASQVAVTLRALIAQNTDYYIEKIYLIVDKNPLPVAGTFSFEPNNGWATISTEIRVNEYTDMRAVAETSDRQLHMSSRFVKAVGGCSALPDSYLRSDKSSFGKMEFALTKKEEFLRPEQQSVAQFKLTHPNASGMQFDQFTRTYIPAHYVHTIAATFNDRPVFTLDTNFSLSQDPSIGFHFVPVESGKMTIYAIDSKNQRFEQSWPIEAIPAISQ